MVSERVRIAHRLSLLLTQLKNEEEVELAVSETVAQLQEQARGITALEEQLAVPSRAAIPLLSSLTMSFEYVGIRNVVIAKQPSRKVYFEISGPAWAKFERRSLAQIEMTKNFLVLYLSASTHGGWNGICGLSLQTGEWEKFITCEWKHDERLFIHFMGASTPSQQDVLPMHILVCGDKASLESERALVVVLLDLTEPGTCTVREFEILAPWKTSANLKCAANEKHLYLFEQNYNVVELCTFDWPPLNARRLQRVAREVVKPPIWLSSVHLCSPDDWVWVCQRGADRVLLKLVAGELKESHQKLPAFGTIRSLRGKMELDESVAENEAREGMLWLRVVPAS